MVVDRSANKIFFEELQFCSYGTATLALSRTTSKMYDPLPVLPWYRRELCGIRYRGLRRCYIGGVERSPRIQKVGVRASVATDLSRDSSTAKRSITGMYVKGPRR